MTFLAPLGLLGFIGIAILILIYIIKPNYHQKFVSTTYIWRLSLKYRKKRIPINKLRNFLIILCQILILISCTLILAQTVKDLIAKSDSPEIVVVIDTSASMRTKKDGVTRFERAIDEASDLVADTFSKDGTISIILAGQKPTYLFQRESYQNSGSVIAGLEELVVNNSCSYGVSDVDGAIVLCESVKYENPDAQIYLITDIEYKNIAKGINVKNVSEKGEWNAGIIDVYTEVEENYYMFIVEVASYGTDAEIEVSINLEDVNALDASQAGYPQVLTGGVTCEGNSVKKLVFVNFDFYENDRERFDNSFDAVNFIPEDEKIFSFRHLSVLLNVDDNFEEDNRLNLYGGMKEVVRIQYSSKRPNVFFSGVLSEIRDSFSKYWDVQITEVQEGDEPAIEGFDFYIYEHSMPSKVPVDGVVMLVNPEEKPSGIEFNYNGVGQNEKVFNAKTPLVVSESHPIINNINASNIEVLKCMNLKFSGTFKTLLECDGIPVLALKDDIDSKVLVLGFSLHFSNLPIAKEFPLLMVNMFDYFFPYTISKNIFETNQTIEVNARGQELLITHEKEGYEKVVNVFPSSFTLDIPGDYILEQTTFVGKVATDYIFVKIPTVESDVCRVVEEKLENPYLQEDLSRFYDDLMIYISAVLLAILFIEWWLASHEAM